MHLMLCTLALAHWHTGTLALAHRHTGTHMLAPTCWHTGTHMLAARSPRWTSPPVLAAASCAGLQPPSSQLFAAYHFAAYLCWLRRCFTGLHRNSRV
jgi:hypothetical protein